MRALILLNLEWNKINRFSFEFLGINNGSLFGFNLSFNFLYIYLFWINIKIFDKTP